MTSGSPNTVMARWAIDSPGDLARIRTDLDRALQRMEAVDCDCFAPSGASPDHVVLIANELASNALEHADGPARVELRCDGATVVVSVTDQRPDLPPVLSPHRDLGEGGFGLQLALRVADEVGWYRDSAWEKRVWARFTLAARDRSRGGSGSARHAAPETRTPVGR
ncbi:ATP-binding protein [Isoptericola sp. 178]|uniref:ATP-binding protein n=1 Tax=Isoptericola sp. 178 TaxID=3064651 RepID=UPI002713D2B1|nr:ATP-binding protein [Isoptericola sp. 178]MDO8143321.1 ATP-binding protein [Isoptericola sp. 178]